MFSLSLSLSLSHLHTTFSFYFTDGHFDVLNISLESALTLPRNKNISNFCLEYNSTYRFCVQMKKKLHFYEYDGSKFNFIKVSVLSSLSFFGFAVPAHAKNESTPLLPLSKHGNITSTSICMIFSGSTSLGTAFTI
jgi:hypothetical protein